MTELTRRGFVRSSAGAAAGLTAVGTFGVGDADAKNQPSHPDPIVAWIGDPRDGTITVMSGKREVVIRDRNLVAQIARVAR